MVDVGFGCGDSLLLHLRHPAVPRPAKLVGVTSLETHWERASSRVHKANPADGPAVTLFPDDAIYRPSVQNSAHPLKDPRAAYTSIIAIDCAYHFRTRAVFLWQAFNCLAPGGRVALADICFERGGAFNRLGRSLLALLDVMPEENMISKAEYAVCMETLGYGDVRVEDVSEDVFPGFARFLSHGHGFGWKVFSMSVRLLQLSGARFVVVSGRKKEK